MSEESNKCSLIGEQVEHKKYGKGILKEIEGDKLIVDFDGNEKLFVFPDAFESYLIFDDATIQSIASELVEKKNIQKAEEEARKAKELESISVQEKKEKKEKQNERDIPYLEILTKGDIFRTHKDALNDCFGFHYTHFQKAFIVIDNSFSVWFPSIARRVQGEYVATETSNGWINVLSENDRVITEKNEDATKNVERELKFELNRFVFAKFDGEDYRFLGVYKSEKVDKPWVTGYKYRLIGTKVNLRTMEIW